MLARPQRGRDGWLWFPRSPCRYCAHGSRCARHCPAPCRPRSSATRCRRTTVCAGEAIARGLPEHYLLFVGTREPRKNLQRLLAAHQSLGADVPPLVIVGARGWGDDVADSYEASDRVHFIGHVASHELAAAYAGARALCYPSVMEGFGLPILEAMAHGTPVLTSKGTSTEEVAAGAAVLVDPLEVSAIAAGIREVLARRDELSQLGRTRATGATWQHTADLVVQAYRAAVEMGGRRA
ncbi:MAG: glycosyltransferase family 1 protein [Actinobacteria bacterium]|nr:glycosyltransferase family 1 protein [Actinomycetota bacterium]